MAKIKDAKPEQPKVDSLAKMNKINQDHQAAVAYIADKETVPKVTVSTWVPMGEAFQDSVKVPGLPIGNITHVYGKPDTGKTTLLMEAIAGCQAAGILPILILTEHKFDFTRLEEWFGVDPEAMVTCHADTIDQAYNIMLKMLKSIQEGKLVVPTEEGKDDKVIEIGDQVCYMLLDSVGNSFSESEMAYEVEEIDKAMGKAAKTIKALTKRVNFFLGKVRQRCGVLILNQSYQSMPSYGPSVETPYGGDGIPYSCVLNIRLRRVKDLVMTIKGVDTVVGLETKIQVMKNHITHLKPISSVYTVAYGMVPPTKEALDEFKKSLR
jgi:RecA/RadA recombinase